MDFSKIILLSTFILLSACGGGSSKDSSPTQPVFSAVDAEINADSASVMIPYTMAMAESTLQIIDLFISELKIQQISAETTEVSLSCGNSGTADFEWQDKDNNMTLSLADTLELTFENCNSTSINGTIVGNASLIVEEKSLDSIGFNVELSAEVSESNVNIPVSGGISFSYNKAADSETLKLFSVQQNFTYIIDGYKEQLDSFELSKRVESNFHYSINYKYEVISEMFAGKLNCESNDAMVGILYATPYKINSQCTGKNQGKISLSKHLDDIWNNTYDAYNDLRISFTSSDGSGSQEESLYSKELFEGTITEPILEIMYQKPVQQEIKKLAIDSSSRIRDMLITTDNSKGYFYDYDSDDALYYINEIDLNNFEITNITSLQREVSKFVLSKDEQFLYITLKEGCCTLPNIFEIDILNSTLSEFASFENVIDSSGSNTEYNYVKNLTSTKEGNVVFILQDEGKFSDENKLVKVSKNGNAEYITLGAENYSGFHLENDNSFYVIQSGNITLFDINGDNFEQLLTKNFSIGSSFMDYIELIEDGKIYTHNGFILDWNSGSIIGEMNVRDESSGTRHMFYLDKFDIAIEIQNKGMNVYSSTSFESILRPVNRQIDGLPDFDINDVWLIGSEYLLFQNRVDPYSLELIKVPMNRLF